MSKKGKGKKDKGPAKGKVHDRRLDKIIKAPETMLKATSGIPEELRIFIEQTEARYKEIHSMFTAIKGFADQELKAMQNLETAFTAVVADLQKIKVILKGGALRAAAPTQDPALVFTSIDALPVADDIKQKLRLGEPENGKRVIRCDWLGTENWKVVNKLVRQMGFKWIKDEQNKKNSRWVEQ